MNPAQKVIKKFGGQTALAKLIGKGQSTVQHWTKSGHIPAKWQKDLLDLAKKQGVSLRAEDFIKREPAIVPEVEPEIPKATHWGELQIGDAVLPCYVLEDGRRVFSLKGVVVGLIETEGGQLAEYIKVKNLKPFLSGELTPAENDAIPCLVKFDTGGHAFTKYAQGLPVEQFIDLCRAYSEAAEATDKKDSEINLTNKQRRVAVNANRFLRACSKIGIIALVDEATGYQYDRAIDALQFKLKLYLEEEMRPWEKTFPDELWKEFGRLTNWKGSLHQRPKYWGKLVMELIYDCLDEDVSNWLRENAPSPRGNLSYHRWLSSQYGLKKLVEHIWMVIGMAKTCETMSELREKVAIQFGRQRVQLNLFLPAPTGTVRKAT